MFWRRRGDKVKKIFLQSHNLFKTYKVNYLQQLKLLLYAAALSANDPIIHDKIDVLIG